MTQLQKVSLAILRVALGFMYLYAGYTKIVNPAWSAAGYLTNAKMAGGFYAWLASPSILPLVNLVNEWGLFLLGVSLLLGVGVRLSSLLGIALMILYYIPLGFPYPNEHALLIDEHIIYAAALLVLYTTHAGRFYGLGDWFKSLTGSKGWLD